MKPPVGIAKEENIYQRKDQVTDWSEVEVPFLFTVIQKENRGFGEIKWTKHLNGRNHVYELADGMSRFHTKSNETHLQNLKEREVAENSNTGMKMEDSIQEIFLNRKSSPPFKERDENQLQVTFNITQRREMEAFQEKVETSFTVRKAASRQLNLLKSKSLLTYKKQQNPPPKSEQYHQNKSYLISHQTT